MTISPNVQYNEPGKGSLLLWYDFPADFLLSGYGKHGGFPSFIKGHFEGFDTANVDMMLLSYCLAPRADIIAACLLLLGRRQGLPTIFNTSPLL